MYCNWNSEHVLIILDIGYNLKDLGSRIAIGTLNM